MPCISGSYTAAAGPLLQVAVLPACVIPQPGGGETKHPEPPMFMAMLDTRASSTCISATAAQAAGLHPSGRTMMSGSDGREAEVDWFVFSQPKLRAQSLRCSIPVWRRAAPLLPGSPKQLFA
jgi:hypothetical protein